MSVPIADRVGVRDDRFVIAFEVIASRPRASGAGQHGSRGSATKAPRTLSPVWRSGSSGGVVDNAPRFGGFSVSKTRLQPADRDQCQQGWSGRDRLADTRSDAEWQPAQSGLITDGGADLLCDGRRAGPAILMRLALTSRRVPRLRRSRETHAEEAHSEQSAAQGDLGRGVALGRQPYGQPAH